METRLIRVAMIAMVLLSVAAPVGGSTSSSSECGQQVPHELAGNASVSELNETGETTSSAENTDVTVVDAPGFMRLQADNPNGYCVRYVVRIGPEVVSPADLGTVESNDETSEASWRAVQDLETGAIETEVVFTLSGGANATFAPSSVRVQSLSWTGTARREGSRIWSGVSDLWGGPPEIEEREVTIEPSGDASRITVPLSNGDQSVEEWVAYYEVGERKAEVTQDASEPVYYSASDSSVTFHFEDRSAVVHMTADPTPVDKVSHSAEMYVAGILEGSSWLDKLPFATAPAGGVA